jgi:GH24 family phage-related lysozyme (muramidase)
MPGGTCEGADPYTVFTEHARVREGYSTTVYADSLGKPTVGIGHLVLPEDGLRIGDVISHERVMEFWHKDSAAAFGAAMHQTEDAGICNPCFIAALASVNFQMGTGWRKKFPVTWSLIMEGKYDEAADELEGSLWNRQTPVRVRDFQAALRALPPKAPSCTLEAPEDPPPTLCDIAPEACMPICYGSCGITVPDPGPPPEPVVIDCAETPGPFSCAAYSRDLFWNPFNKNSMYHIPLACGLRYAGDNDATTRAWKANTFGNFKIGCVDGPNSTRAFCDENAHPIFAAPPGTPTEVVAKFGPGNGLPVTVRMPPEAKIRLDRGGGKDATMSIYYTDTADVYVFYGYSYEPGGASAERHLKYNARGTGHPNRPGDPDVGTPASGVANWLGILRGHEASATGWDFNHRFKIAVVRKDNQGPAHILGRNFHLPANGTDGGITGGENLGPFNYGDIVALPPNIDVNTLGLSEPGTRFARAMQQYGIIIADGGPNGTRGDQILNDADRDAIARDFKKIWDLMRRVEDMTSNDDFNRATAAGKIGPGAPMGPNCAFDSADPAMP